MIGTYTEITIVAQDTALVDETVVVELRVKNLCDYTIDATPVIEVNGGRSEGEEAVIVPEETLSWSFSFIMPSDSVIVTGESWCGSDFFAFALDVTVDKTISLASAAPDILSSILPFLVLGLLAGLMIPTVKGAFK